MEKHPAKKEKTALEKPILKESNVINPMAYFNPFISFRYSYKSIYSDGEKTHIKAKENKFENGKFETQEFEGTMEQKIYDQMVMQMNDYFIKQIEFFLRPFSYFSTGFKKDKNS